jgi:hypothetical protein
MTRFIWVRDADLQDHYINVKHIICVTQVPAHGINPALSTIILSNENPIGNSIRLSLDKYDTAEDVIAKIQMAMV